MQEATDYAQQRAEVFKNELQFLIDKQNEEKKNAQQLITQNYENMINTLNQGRVPIEQQYQENARQAYVNKMLAGKQLEGDLTRLGLDTTGFALSQKISNENQYSANLNQLALDRAAGLRGIDDKITNAQGQMAADLLKANIDYDVRLNQLNQYISERVEDKYNDEYNKFMSNLQYEDEKKQQAIINEQNWYKLQTDRASVNNSGGGFGGLGGSGDLEDTEPDNTMYYDQGNTEETYKKDDYYFKNSLQPRYIENKKLSTSGMFSQDLEPFLNKIGSSLAKFGAVKNQNIWKREDGTYWLWDSTPDEYGNLGYNDITRIVQQYLRSDYTKEKLAKAKEEEKKAKYGTTTSRGIKRNYVRPTSK